MSFIILVPLFAVMYFVMIRPQQKRASAHREILASIEPGDEVLTSAGFYGVITEFDGPTVFIEIADGVEMKVTRDSISGIVNYDDPDDSADSDGSRDGDKADHKGPIS